MEVAKDQQERASSMPPGLWDAERMKPQDTATEGWTPFSTHRPRPFDRDAYTFLGNMERNAAGAYICWQDYAAKQSTTSCRQKGGKARCMHVTTGLLHRVAVVFECIRDAAKGNEATLSAANDCARSGSAHQAIFASLIRAWHRDSTMGCSCLKAC